MMPTGGAEARGEQLAALSVIIHEEMTSSRLAALLDRADEQSADLTAHQQRNLALMRHKWHHANAISADLVEKSSLLGNKCEMVWREARENNDFTSYCPIQQDVLEITREIAQSKAEIFGCSRYDALLDSYDPARKSAEIDVIFSELEGFLPSFLHSVMEQQKDQPSPIIPQGPFPIDKQRALVIHMMKTLGFDFNRGRLDTSHHPFCGGSGDDVRITTKFKEDDFTFALMGVLHETGHALYEHGLPHEYRGQPIGESLGMTIHESQSLLMEMQVCRGHPFLTYAAPIIAEHLGDSSETWSLANLSRIYSRVKPGHIRIDADEITYPLHVMLRYQLEKRLIEGEIDFKDVPEIWNQYMKEKLNVIVENDSQGCMQDIHWTDGSFGYFPTYTLGAISAAQFYHTARQNPDVEYGIKRGDFSPLLTWLRKHVHGCGSEYSPAQLVKNATGQDLSCDIYINHLKNRYLS